MGFGETECLSEDNVETVVDTDFMAKCMKNTKISIVNVWITDCEVTNTFLDLGDNAEIPECCHPGEECKTVQYTFKLPCVNPCPEDGSEVAEEAPPSGVHNDKVHVCHYSARDGYKTFCVPE